jgi:hypothetical protein
VQEARLRFLLRTTYVIYCICGVKRFYLFFLRLK